MNRRRIVQVALVCVLSLVTLACKSQEPLPVLGQIPEISLTDSQGQTVSLKSLANRPVFFAFFFTRCPSVCPRLVARTKEIEKAVGDPSKVGFVLISVDPEFDSPEVLRNYGTRLGLGAESFSLLTGAYRTIAEAAETGFKIGIEGKYAADQPGLGITHGSHLVLVDRHGQIRKYVRTFDDGAVDEASRAVKSLSGE
jgi:protein SCO1